MREDYDRPRYVTSQLPTINLAKWKFLRVRMPRIAKAVFPIIFVFLRIGSLSAESAKPGRIQNAKFPAVTQHEVSVALKLVQAQVVDAKGKFVTDLGKSDFEVFDNGQRREITDFEKHDLNLSPNAVDSQRLELVGGSNRLSRKFFLFFDFAFNYPAGIAKSIRAAQDFLDKHINPEDEIGIISYSVRSGLRVHEFLTKDRVKIRQIITGLGEGRAMGRAVDLADRYYEELKKLATSLGSSTDGIEHIQAVERSMYEECAADFANQLKVIASALRYVPGNKNIMLFSSGITNMVLYGKRIEDSRTFSEKYGSSRVREKFIEMCKALAASNSVIYPVNVAGQASARFDDHNMSGDGSLKQMASETGGKYFDNIMDYQKINREILERTAAYYVLGYYVSEEYDGTYHTIKVKVKRKGCHVYAQRGYFNPKPFREYSENEKILHLIDLALADHPSIREALDFPLSVVPFSTQEKAGLVLLAKVPIAVTDLVVGQRVEAMTLILNRERDIVALNRAEITRWPRPDGEVFISTLVFLGPGEYFCSLVLRNMEAGTGARGSCRAEIRLDSESGFIQTPPLILERGKGAFLSALVAEGNDSQKELRLIDIYPFNMEEYHPLIGPLHAGSQQLLAMIRCRASDKDDSTLDFSCYCRSTEFEGTVPITTSVLKRRRIKEADIYDVWLQTPDLGPGDYMVYLIAKERYSGASSTATSAFQVSIKKTGDQFP